MRSCFRALSFAGVVLATAAMSCRTPNATVPFRAPGEKEVALYLCSNCDVLLRPDLGITYGGDAMSVHYFVDLVQKGVVVASATCWGMVSWGSRPRPYRSNRRNCILHVSEGGPSILRVRFGIGIEPYRWHIERADLDLLLQ